MTDTTRNGFLSHRPPLLIHERVAIHAEQTPSHPAIVSQSGIMDYARLNTLSTQIAEFLITKRIRPGDPVAVLMQRSPLQFAAMLGIFKAGGIFVPLHPGYPDDQIRTLLEDCQTHLILTDNLQRIPEESLFKATLLDENREKTSAPSPSSHPTPSIDENAIACIVYISESSEFPKGVLIRHRNLSQLAERYQSAFGLTHQDRSSQCAALGQDTYFCETIPFLANGASIHIMDDALRLNPPSFLDWLTEDRITCCHLPVSYALVLFSSPWPDNHYLRMVKLSGSRLVRYPDARFGFDLWYATGSVEVGFDAFTLCLARAGESSLALREKYPFPPIGKPVQGVQYQIVDRLLQPVKEGQEGELLIGGECLTAGYLNRPESMRERFILLPSEPNSPTLWFRTGESVRIGQEGHLESMGRLANKVKIRGVHVALQDIESCIASFSDVSQAIVLSKKNEQGEHSLMAWLVPHLQKIRIPWKGKCLVALDHSQYLDASLENLSREGIGLSGFSEDIPLNQQVSLHVTLPGSDDSVWLKGKVVWCHSGRAGIQLRDTPEQKQLMDKCINHYLATHNLMETLETVAVNRNLKIALKNRLPEYMIPKVFCLLPRLPIAFDGKVDIKALPIPNDYQQLVAGESIDPQTETEKELAALWKKMLKKSSISMKDNFFDLGGNSLQITEFCLEIKKRYGVTLPSSIYMDRPWLPIIAEYIDSRGEQFTLTSPQQNQIMRDMELADELIPLPSHKRNGEPEKILLTGINGHFGMHLLYHLLKDTKAILYCLTRKDVYENTVSQFNRLAGECGFSNENLLEDSRIVLVAGDALASHFRMPQADYEKLAGQIDSIWLCSAEMNAMASYTALRGTNVMSTMEVLRFACRGKSKRIHYISTLTAACHRNESGQYREVFPDSRHDGLTGGYALSKWVSERLLTQIMQRGLPVNIYRPGLLLGDTQSFTTHSNIALFLLIKGCIQLGIAPDWESRVTALPIDFVSQSVVALSGVHPDRNRVYHIDHPTGIAWNELVCWFQSKGYPIRRVSHEHWLRKLGGISRSNALYPVLPYYLAMDLPPDNPPIEMRNTVETLQKCGMTYPEMNPALLESCLNTLLQNGFLPAPATEKTSQKFITY